MEWFKRGKLGDDPRLPRPGAACCGRSPGLSFDVIPIPAIERNATVGDFTGMCVSADTGNATAAADFLVHMTSPVSSAGWPRPATWSRPTSRWRSPTTSCSRAGSRCTRQVFTNSVRTIVLPPLIDDWADARGRRRAAASTTLLTAPVLTDLEALTPRIDEESQTVLAPGRGAERRGRASESALSPSAWRLGSASAGSAARARVGGEDRLDQQRHGQRALPGAGAVARAAARRPPRRAARGRGWPAASRAPGAGGRA